MHCIIFRCAGTPSSAIFLNNMGQQRSRGDIFERFTIDSRIACKELPAHPPRFYSFDCIVLKFSCKQCLPCLRQAIHTEAGGRVVRHSHKLKARKPVHLNSDLHPQIYIYIFKNCNHTLLSLQIALEYLQIHTGRCPDQLWSC